MHKPQNLLTSWSATYVVTYEIWMKMLTGFLSCLHASYNYHPPLGSLVSPIQGEIRLPVRSPPCLLPGAMALTAPPAGLHHLHHGGPLSAPPCDYAIPVHAHRHRAVDPQESGRLFSAWHNEPQGDRQDLAVGFHPLQGVHLCDIKQRVRLVWSSFWRLLLTARLFITSSTKSF